MTDTFQLRSDRCVLGDTPESLRVVPARLTIEGPWIREVVEEDAPPKGSFDGLDLGEQLVSPAFVNAHTHLSMNAFRGLGGLDTFEDNVIEDLYYRIETTLSADDVGVFTRLGALESLLSGVGLVWDHYYHGRAVAEAVADVGLAAVVAPTLQDLDGPGRGHLDAQLEATLSIDGDARLADHGVVAGLGPHATDTVSADAWRRICAAADEHDLPIHVHLAQSHHEYARAHERHGCSPLQWLRSIGVLDAPRRLLLVHGIFLSREDLALLSPERHTLAFCPYSQVQFCFPADVARWEHERLPWIVATDCGASNDSMNVQKELRWVGGMRGLASSFSEEYASFVEEGSVDAAHAAEARRQESYRRLGRLSDPRFLLSRVWSIPGRLHPRLPAGVLAPDHLANLVVWDVSHPSFWPLHDPLRALALNDTTAAIEAMMVAGRWRGERGRFHASLLAETGQPELRRDADARLRELRGHWNLEER